MSNESKVNVNVPGFFTLLTILFIGLKLCGVITWSWLWVLSPLWIPLAIVVLVFFILLIVFAIKDDKR